MVAAAAIPCHASAQPGPASDDTCYAKDGALGGAFDTMWQGDPSATPVRAGCEQIALGDNRIAVRTEAGECWAKEGLTAQFSLMSGPNCAQIALGDNRMAARNSDDRCWAKEGMWGQWQLMSAANCAQIAVGDNRMVARNNDGSCWAKEGMAGQWHLMSGPNCAQIAVGDNRMAARNSDGRCWAKEGMWGQWHLMSGPNCAQIAVGDNRMVAHNSDNTCWAKEGMFGQWVGVGIPGSTCAQIAVGGNRIGVRTTDGRCYARDGMSGQWVIQWEFSKCLDIRLSGTRVGIRADRPDSSPGDYTSSFSDSFELADSDFPEPFQPGAWCRSGCGTNASGKLLDGSGGHINQVAPPGFSAADGTKVVDAGLTPTSTRAEIQCHRSATPLRCAGGEGSEFVYEFDIRVPSGYTLPGRATNVMQTKPTVVVPKPEGHYDTGCYGGGLQVDSVPGDASKVELLLSSRAGVVINGGSGFCSTTFGTLDSLGIFPKNAWHRFKLRARWSTQASVGLIQAWMNGEEKVARRSQPTLIEGAGRQQMFRIGLYESDNADNYQATFRVYYDNVVIRTKP